MRRALSLAARARGKTSPNPMVGAVVVRRGRIVGEGFHPAAGEPHAEVLALLADGEAWSSSALALALDVSPRTVQRALEVLAEDDRVKSFGRGRACRWMVPNVPGFPTSLLLPAPPTSG